MKKKLTLFFALTIFASAAFAQCDALEGVIVTVNNSKNKLLLNFGDAGAAATFLGIVGGENSDVTITDGPGSTIDGPIVTSPSNNEVLRVTLVPNATNSGSYSGTITFHDAGTPFSCEFTAGALPVSLISFTGKKMEKSILLEWKTESELNNDYFAVERSVDGRDFEQLTKVSGKGTSTELLSYSFEDKNPKSTTNYYRLRQVEYDGTESFSDIITVKFKATRVDLNLYPTLVREEVNLDMINYENENVVINVLSTTGQIVLSEVVDNGNIVTLNLGSLNLSEGMYFVHCRLASRTIIGKFLIVK